jgi:hypothetical protein
MLNFEEDIKVSAMPLGMMRISSFDETSIMQKLAIQVDDSGMAEPTVHAPEVQDAFGSKTSASSIATRT